MRIEEPDQFRNNLKTQLNKFLKNKKISSNLEIAIYNNCIQQAKKKKIVRKWDNKYFVQLYIDRFRSIYSNITILHHFFGYI